MSTDTIMPIVIDPATGIREITTRPGGMTSGVRVFTNGRNARGRFADWDAVRVTVTAKGHWYRSGDVNDGLHNDTICRGCGHHGHFDYILDYQPCTRPATAEDVQAALSGPARKVQPGDRVWTMLDGIRVYGVVRSIYRDETGTDVADLDLDGGNAFLTDLKSVAAA